MKHPHHRFTLFVSMLVGLCAAATASEKLEIRHYPVSGKDLPALRDSLREHGPAGKDGQSFHALTEWNVEWSFSYSWERNTCRIKNIDTRIKASMILPQWQDKAVASEQDQRQWERYSEALRQHEDGHYLMATSVASDIREQLARLSAPACDTLEAEFNARAQSMVNDYLLKELAYDRETDHGLSQGAIL